MISFNAIPVGIRTPGAYVEIDATRATNGLTPGLNRVLLIGQRLAVGTVAALTPTPVTEAGQADGYFGRGSHLARMARALKAADRLVEVVAIALDDAGGSTAATGTITVTGPATAAGTIALMIAGQRVAVGVASGATANTIATAIGAAINAALDLPVTAGVAAAVVTLTARNKGTGGAEIDVRHSYFQGEALPTGVALAIVAMAGGATDPDYATIWPVIGDAPYSAIAIGTATSAIIAACKTELDSRFAPDRALDAFLWGAKPGTQGTLAAFGSALNSQLVSIMGTGKSPSPPWEWAASMAGIGNASGNIDPARPLQTLSLPGIIGPIESQRLTRAERELLLKDGISTYKVDPDGTVRIERAITTYQLNAAGVDDTAYLDVETVRTLTYLRQAVRTRISLKYPRHKLAGDDVRFGPGQAIVTPKILRAELIALFRELEEAGLVENLDQFIGDLIVERNATDPNRVDALIPPDIVNQFRIFAGQIQFRL